MNLGDFPAFSIQGPDAMGSLYAAAWLTKREFFAAMAMQGLCANAIPGPQHGFKQRAAEAVAQADALLAELYPIRVSPVGEGERA